jgi:predicted transcriptional regulator
MPESKQVSVVIPQELFERLVEVAETERRPTEELVVLAVSEFLKPF